MIRGAVRLREFATENKIEFKSLVRDEYFDPEFFQPKNFFPHHSWKHLNRSQWLHTSAISYHEYETVLVVIDQTVKSKYINLRARINKIVSQYNRKEVFIKWRCKLPDSNVSFSRALNRSLNRLWDGMNLYPYTIEEKEQAIYNTIERASKILASKGSIGNEHLVRKVFLTKETDVLLDVGTRNGIFNKIVIDSSKFDKTLRSDLFIMLKKEINMPIRNQAYHMLFVVHNPSFLFEFESFKTIFASEILPYQVLAYKLSDPVLFSPVDIEIMGVA